MMFSTDVTGSPRATMRCEQRYTITCEACGWRSYPFLDESVVVVQWQEHVRSTHLDG